MKAFYNYLKRKGYTDTGAKEIIQRIKEGRPDREDKYEIEAFTDSLEKISPLDLSLLDEICGGCIIYAVEHYTEPQERGVVFFVTAADGTRKEITIKSESEIKATVTTTGGRI